MGTDDRTDSFHGIVEKCPTNKNPPGYALIGSTSQGTCRGGGGKSRGKKGAPGLESRSSKLNLDG